MKSLSFLVKFGLFGQRTGTFGRRVVDFALGFAEFGLGNEAFQLLHQDDSGAGSGKLDLGELALFAADDEIFNLKIALAAAHFGRDEHHPAEAAANVLVGDIINLPFAAEIQTKLTETECADLTGCLIFRGEGGGVIDYGGQRVEFHGVSFHGPERHKYR